MGVLSPRWTAPGELDRRRLDALDGAEDDLVVASASTTIVSPAWNSFHRIFSESGSSTMRWIARRSGRAPSAGS